MLIAYHIDRRNSLKPGDELHLRKTETGFSDVDGAINRIYPEGLSSHGFAYYFLRTREEKLREPLIENLFEYERRLHFPHRVSRFQSVFASETKEEADYWLSLFSTGYSCLVHEIEFDERQASKLDASWLLLDEKSISFPQTTYFAHQYWSWKASPNPRWELLIKPPIRVIRSV